MTDSDPSDDSTAESHIDETAEDVDAAISGSAQHLTEMIERSSVLGSGDPLYDRLYIRVEDETVELVGGTRSGGVMSYCTFDPSYFESVTGEGEAVVEVADFLNYLDIASDGGRVSLQFRRDDDDTRLAQQLEIQGKLTSSIMLPSGSSVLEHIPLTVAERFDDDDQMLTSAGRTLTTQIWTSAGDLQKIVDAVALQDGESFYPIVVEDGEFVIELGNTQTQYIAGDLSGDVAGDDLRNEFADEFEQIVDALDGDIRISTSEGVLGSFVSDAGQYVTRTVMGVAQGG